MRHIAAIALIMSLPFTAAIADVYRYVDAQGQVHYSDTPTPGAELVHVQKLGIQNSAPSPSSDAKALAKSDAQIHTELAQQSAQRAVQQDVEQTRADQCKKATADYDQAVQARRIYKPGADGEREYMSDADADQMRLNLRLAMQSACGSSQ
jgi:hypothetical protein